MPKNDEDDFLTKKPQKTKILLFRSCSAGAELVLELQNQSVSISYYYLVVASTTISESE